MSKCSMINLLLLKKDIIQTHSNTSSYHNWKYNINEDAIWKYMIEFNWIIKHWTSNDAIDLLLSQHLQSTLQVIGRVSNRFIVVVMKKSVLPQWPCLGVGQNRNGSVQKSDGCATGIVIGNPTNGALDARLGRVQQAGTSGSIDVDRIEHRLHFWPQISHVKVVNNAFQWCPVFTKTIIGLADQRQDAINDVHLFGGKVVTNWQRWCIFKNFLVFLWNSVHIIIS